MTTFVFAQDIDYLNLSEVLIKGGNYSKAKNSLLKAKKQWSDIDQNQYHLLDGLLSLRKKNYLEATEKLLKVEDDYLDLKYTYLAQSYIGLKQFEKARAYYFKIESKDKAVLKYLGAEIEFLIGHYNKTFEILEKENIKNLDKTKLLRIHYALKINLVEYAFKGIQSYLKTKKDVEEFEKMAKVLIGVKEYSKALTIAELGLVKNRASTKLMLIKAAILDIQKNKYSAGNQYISLAYTDMNFAYEATEYLKNSNRDVQAGVINMHVLDTEKQILQRLSLLIDNENYDMAAGLDIPIRQFDIYKNDEVKYAMAYTYLQNGDYDYASKLLGAVKSKKLISKSIKLLEVVEECKKTQWICHGKI